MASWTWTAGAATLALVGAIAWTQAPRPPRFEGRRIANSQLADLLSWPVAIPSADEHRQAADSSLILRSPIIVDDPRFGIGSAIGLVLGQLDPTRDPNQALQNWHHAAGSAVSAFKDGEFRLLAVVNRSDLAMPEHTNGVENGRMAKVEIRFEYGVIRAEQQGQAFAILEAELKSMSKAEFKAYSASWFARNKKAHDLVAGHFQTHGVERARIRITGNVGNVWELRQFDYKSGSFQVGPLSREFPKRSRSGANPTPCLKEWIGTPANIRRVLDNDYELDSSGSNCAAADILFKLPTEQASILPDGIDPLSLENHIACNGCSPADRDKIVERIRVNACSRCHSEVHGAQFVHIAWRREGKQSQLSSFLTGKPHAGTGATFYSDTPLAEQHPGSHNDLLRRHLFAKKVSTLDPMDINWKQSLQDLWAPQAH